MRATDRRGRTPDLRRAGRVVLGLLLVVLGLLPGSLLLDPEIVGPFGQWVLVLESGSLELMLWGSFIVLGGGFVLARTIRTGGVESVLSGVRGALLAVPPYLLSMGLGLTSVLLAAAGSHYLSGMLPTYADSMAQLVQARFLADGMLAGPNPDPPASQVILNTLLTEEGWVSLYPPGHTLLLAGGLLAGAPGWVGPILTGVTVAASAMLVMELLADHPGTARLAAVLTALSPFLLLVGGGYLSHTSCAAGIALAAWCGHRAASGRWIWAIGAGAATGLAVASRPWIGLAVPGVLLPMLWVGRARAGALPLRWLAPRVAGAVLGGAPFAILLLGYNTVHFGSPTRLAYEVAYGPAHGLGLHQNPWGYPYGLLEALGYTAADLSALSMHLLETPLPLVALVGLFIAGASRLPEGSGILLAWALVPVLANFLYWHHGFHLGPRMLYEAAPAWCALAALTAAWLTGRLLPADRTPPDSRTASDGPIPSNDSDEAPWIAPRAIAFWTLILALGGPVFLVPARLGANAWDSATRARMSPPLPDSAPALVFVHGSWPERVSARMQASGIRYDSLELALRRNDLCRVDRYARNRLAGRPLPDLDFSPSPGMPEGLRELEAPGGYRIRGDPTTEMSAECRRELGADRRGTVALDPLLWQGDLAGAERGRPVFVRDMGPELNEVTFSQWPGRSAYLWTPPRPGEEPELRPYREVVEELWGEAAGQSAP
ncbi:MAG: ArnT family glycosyltransferase [Gemmatimonadota bacterium]